MELRQLEYLVAVAEDANFTRAAQRLHVAQPAVSAQIQRLERDVGQPLFDRTKRTVRLTAAGRAMLPYARAALSAVADAQTAVDEVGRLVRGSVTIGTVTSHNVDMPALLADFHADHPGVEITLGTDSSDGLIEGVRAGRWDVVIVSIGPNERPEGLDFAVVTDEAIMIAVGQAHEWSARSRVRLADLGRTPLIALPVGAGIRHQFDAACAAAGVAPVIAFEATTPTALADLAEHGLGAAVIPESVARSRAGLHALALEPALRGRLVLAWRSTGPVSPAARVLIEKARQFV